MSELKHIRKHARERERGEEREKREKGVRGVIDRRARNGAFFRVSSKNSLIWIMARKQETNTAMFVGH